MIQRLRPALLNGAAVALLLSAAAPAATRLGRSELTEGNPDLAKVSSHLLRARALDRRGLTAAEVAAEVALLEYRDGLPQVAIRLKGATLASLERLQKAGLVVDSFHTGYGRAYGRVDPDDLAAIAALPEVVTVRPKERRFTRAGSATNQADETMNADDVRTLFGYDGTGVEVGVLSDSFRDLSAGSVSGSGCTRMVTGTSSQTSGDLPATVYSLDDGPGGGSDEARAIGELIFDIAPSATFSFHSAFNSAADFADGITELAGCGADVIVDDVGYFGQAFFQDDIIAQAAQDAFDGGIPYFSATGNDATFGIDNVFVDPSPTNDLCAPDFPDGDDLHDFDPGAPTDNFAEISVPDDCNIFAELQWADPFESLDPPAPPDRGAEANLDLYLLESPVPPDTVGGANVLDSSTDSQGCPGSPSGDPIEQVFYDNTSGSTKSVFLAINGCCGFGAKRFRVINVSFNCGTTFAPWDFEDGESGETAIFMDPQIWGHPAAKDAIAVAASFYGEIFDPEGFPPGIINPPSGQLDVNEFSSLGGDLPFFFDSDGNPISGGPESRSKPDVTGPDGVNNSFFGIDFGFDSDADPNFSGTSAAAPNAAAIAALLLDATDLKINPLPLKQLLEQSAIDIEDPGFDDLSGFGFTDALRPIRSLDPTDTPLIDDLEFDLDGGAFFSSPPSGGTQRLQANDTLLLEDGDFTGLEGIADSVIFADGFESGDTSAWSSSSP